MDFTRSLAGVLLAMALGLSACAGPMMSTEVHPTPRHQDLPLGLEDGLIAPGWGGGHPLRVFAFLINPFGVLMDLAVSQSSYLLSMQEPELFGYTVHDENYRRELEKLRYSWWKAPEK
jgi:hypothetical protein